MSLHLITAPARYPVTLIEAKEHLRVDDNNSDAYIDSLIEAATAMLDGRDGILGRCLVQQTWELRLPDWQQAIEIPLPPLVSVSSVKYLDTGGVEQTLSTSYYDVIDQGFGMSVIQPAYGQSYPSVRSQPNAIRIRYVAGYASVSNGGLTGTIPRPIIQNILNRIGDMYENRQNRIVGNAVNSIWDADASLTPYIVSWV
jgi:uncharacterized phiE125 gp8 family phage protein